MFAPEDFARMAVMLAGIKGRFVLSINDVPPIREAFAGFHLTPLGTTCTIGAEAMKAAELLISKRALPTSASTA